MRQRTRSEDYRTKPSVQQKPIKLTTNILFYDLSAAMLATAGAAPGTKVLDLKRRLKCRECRWKGRTQVSVRWG